MGHFPWLCWITRGYLRKPPPENLCGTFDNDFPWNICKRMIAFKDCTFSWVPSHLTTIFFGKNMQNIARIIGFQVIWQWFLLEKWTFLGFQVGFHACSHEIDHDFPGRSWALPMDLRGGWRPRQWTRHMARWSGKLVVCGGSIIVSSGKLTVCYKKWP